LLDGLEPFEAAVLVAVARGLKSVDEIAEVLNTRVEDVERVVERLIARGLLARVEKRGILGRRVELRLTEKGYNMLPMALRILEDIGKRVRKRLEEGKRRASASGGVVITGVADAVLLPFLVWLGLVPLELLLVQDVANMVTSIVDDENDDEVNDGDTEEMHDEDSDFGDESLL